MNSPRNRRVFPMALCSLLILMLCAADGCNELLQEDRSFGVARTDDGTDGDTDGGDDGGDDGDTTETPVDDDGDGLSNTVEATFGIDRIDADTDQDGYNDGLEFVVDSGDPLDAGESPSPLNDIRFLLPEEVVGADPDADQDGLGSFFERTNGLDPEDPDTDDDGYEDGLELVASSNPFDSSSRPVRSEPPVSDGIDRPGAGPDDTDQDGLSDETERLFGSVIDEADSDTDGFSDGLEFLMGSDALDQRSIPNFTVPTPP